MLLWPWKRHCSSFPLYEMRTGSQRTSEGLRTQELCFSTLVDAETQAQPPWGWGTCNLCEHRLPIWHLHTGWNKWNLKNDGNLLWSFKQRTLFLSFFYGSLESWCISESTGEIIKHTETQWRKENLGLCVFTKFSKWFWYCSELSSIALWGKNCPTLIENRDRELGNTLLEVV